MVLPDEKVVVIGIEESSEPVMVFLKGSTEEVKVTGIVNYTFSITDKAERGELSRLLDPQNAHTGMQ